MVDKTQQQTIQELIRRWDTRTWRDVSSYLCLLISHCTTTHLYFRNILS